VGVVYGRNIFQHEDPRAALAQVMQVVHKVAQ
jgi:DhnA family fructose-bisphosphate aldolase class Ia